MARELPTPPDLINNRNAVEILRVWIAGDKQRFALRSDAWSDPAAWGLLLADIARHAAQAYAQKLGGDPQAALERIKQGLDAEWSSPTDAESSRS